MLIRNARVVTRDEVFTGVVRVEDGKISDVERGTTAAREAEDWEGDYLLPGLIELHTDNLEKHLVPRPGVQWNTDAAFVIHDAQVAAAGITTVFDSLAIGSRSNVGLRGPRIAGTQMRRWPSPAFLRAPVAACRAFPAPALRDRHRRCRGSVLPTPLCAHPLLRLASVMDHTPGQRQWHDRNQWRRYPGTQRQAERRARHDGTGRTDRRAAALCRREPSRDCQALRGAERAGGEPRRHRRRACRRGGCRRYRARRIPDHPYRPPKPRASIASSTIMLPRRTYRARRFALGQCVRAGTRQGGFARYPVIGLRAVEPDDRRVRTGREGWLDAAARHWRTVSAEPARTAGLHDRGAIAPGLRADFVRVTMLDTLPVPRATYREGARIV